MSEAMGVVKENLEDLPVAEGCNVCSPLMGIEGDNRSSSPYKELVASGKTCAGCKLICDGVHAFNVHENQDLDKLEIMERAIFSTFRIWKKPTDKELKDKKRWPSVEFYVEEGDYTPFFDTQVLADVPGDTSSNQSFGWIKAQLSDCTTNHEGCCQSEETLLPHRILQIEEGIAGKLKVRLCESREEVGTYMCLSHCWGGNHPLRTTRSNIEDHKRDIPWSQIPKTFQDAITLTKKLGVRYLWIDSLCIIQDDDMDWERESSFMCSVYENAYLTLAATKSGNSHEGLFSKTDPVHIPKLLHGMSDGIHWTVRAREPIYHINVTRFDIEHDRHKDMPLMDRGWVYQERILSARVLHFGPQELFWECKETIRCECKHFDSGSHIPGFHRPDKMESYKAVTGDSPGHVAEEWRFTVAQYTKLNLTVGADKLSALSGIAKMFERERRRAAGPESNGGDEVTSRYVAGLWADSFEQDLLWSSWFEPGILPPPRRAEGWRAPTWSWASIDGAISFFLTTSAGADLREGGTPPPWEEFISQCCVVDYHYETEGLDPTGRLKSGWLKIYGKRFPVWVAKEVASWKKGSASEIKLTCPGWKGMTFSPDVSVDKTGEDVINVGELLYAFLVGRDSYPADTTNAYYLILKEAPQQENVFVRVGSFKDYSDDAPLLLQEELIIEGEITLI